MGIKMCIQNVLYASSSKRNLLSFKDIRSNGYHIEILNVKDMENWYVTSFVFGRKVVLEKFHTLHSVYIIQMYPQLKPTQL